MSEQVLGIGAAPGRAVGRIFRVQWQIPAAPHRTIAPEQVPAEIDRFERARAWARERIAEQRAHTAAVIGEVEAKIFDPQTLMLDDPELVEGTLEYIEQNYLSAERAFDWRITEVRMRMFDLGHVMVLDRLADIEDVRHRVLARLAGQEQDPLILPDEPGILAFRDLTPSVAVRLDPELVLGLVTAAGSRTAHSAVLARSKGIPAVVGVGADLSLLVEGATALLDGGTGRVVVDPDPNEIEAHHRMADRLSEWTAQGAEWADRILTTTDGVEVRLLANLDQPDDVVAARRVGARGIGLFRSEFLVIGRRVIPSEEEQFQAYRRVVAAYPDHPVTLRTFDIGGDKFPLFLDAPAEENPYLGWRAIRVCLDLPELFENQLRAALRADSTGQLRILLPFVTDVEQVIRTREILAAVADDLALPSDRINLGVMVETPAAVETLDFLSEEIDFISLGTNDLTQYFLAVDRGNARLAHLADPLHPAMIRAYARVERHASRSALDLSVCGDIATDPAGVSLLIALGYRQFSLPPSSLPEIRELIRRVSVGELRGLVGELGRASDLRGLRQRIGEYLDDTLPFEPSTRPRKDRFATGRAEEQYSAPPG